MEKKVQNPPLKSRKNLPRNCVTRLNAATLDMKTYPRSRRNWWSILQYDSEKNNYGLMNKHFLYSIKNRYEIIMGARTLPKDKWWVPQKWFSRFHFFENSSNYQLKFCFFSKAFFSQMIFWDTIFDDNKKQISFLIDHIITLSVSLVSRVGFVFWETN